MIKSNYINLIEFYTFIRINYLTLIEIKNMIKRFFKFLERFEKYFPHVFWCIVCKLSLVWNFPNKKYSPINQTPFSSNFTDLVQNVPHRLIEVKEDFEP